MEDIIFTPKSTEGFYLVKHYSSNPQYIGKSKELFDVIQGNKHKTYKQTEWMGRGCYDHIAPNKDEFFIGKGVGPGAGSELMRNFLAHIRNNDAGEGKLGGCLRIDTGIYYLFLVQFIETEDGFQILDPRPEGFSIFGALYREAEAGILYKENQVSIIEPISLFHHKIENLPWKNIGFEKYIKDAFKKELLLYTNNTLDNKKLDNIHLTKASYFDLDGGLLTRVAKTPYRISNLLNFVTDNNKEGFSILINHLDKYFSENNISIEILVKELAKTAGILFKKGIIHGQFKTHFQNISLFGEIGDFDSSIFLGMFPGFEKLGIDIVSSDKIFYANFMQSIRQGEAQYQIDMNSFIQDDLKLFSGGSDFNSVSNDILSMNMLGQIYDLYVQSLRLYDLYARKHINKINSPGTILTVDQIQNIQGIFLQEFFRQNINYNLLDWVINNGVSMVKEKYLNKQGRSTIYGRHMKNMPLDYINIDCSPDRQNFIYQDFDSFIHEIKS